MDEGSRARSEAIRAMQDVTPDRLRERIEARLAAAPAAPGEVTIASARYHGADVTEGTVMDLAGAVQQIFVGLRITRELIETNPWHELDNRPSDADLEIVAADVLIARGVSRLASTAAAETAVEVVRTFGQEQAERLEHGRVSEERSLEATILELAVVAGAASSGVTPEASVRRTVPRGPGVEPGRMPPTVTVLEGTVLEPVAEVGPRAGVADDGLRSGASDTD